MATPPTGLPEGRPSKYRTEFCDIIVEEMAKGYTFTAAAAGMGVSRATLELWRSVHPEFSDAVAKGEVLRQKQFETAALMCSFPNMAVARNADGTLVPIPTGNPGMIQLGLRNCTASGKKDWDDSPTKVELTGAAQGPIKTVALQMTADNAADAAKEYQLMMGASD